MLVSGRLSMKKKIPLSQVRVGMTVSPMSEDWHLTIATPDILQRVLDSGLKEVLIDTVAKSKSDEVKSEEKPEPEKRAQKVHPFFVDGASRAVADAKKTYKIATATIRSLMDDVRSGKSLNMRKAEDVAEQIIKSLDSNPMALNVVTRIKSRDEYTFQHSIGVAALLSGFTAETYGRADVEEFTVGGIIHDIGKVMTPDSVLNKPGKLTEDEFEIMKRHVVHSREILEETGGFTKRQADIALQHHERPDGKGYPLGLHVEKLSKIGKTAAIIDVYDALSTRRVYKEAWEPTQALQSMVKWGPGQLDQDILKGFIKYIGVYPIGTWVLLESNRVGFVASQNIDLLHPIVHTKLDVKTRRLICQDVNLLDRNDRIVKVVSPFDYGLSEVEF